MNARLLVAVPAVLCGVAWGVAVKAFGAPDLVAGPVAGMTSGAIWLALVGFDRVADQPKASDHADRALSSRLA